jgi:hypothetical protein
VPVSKLHSKYLGAPEPALMPIKSRASAASQARRPSHNRPEPKGARPIIDQRIRERIQVAAIVNILTEHVKGKRKMRSTQVRAALGLLAKVLPDLQTIDLTAQITVRKVVRDEPLSIEEFERKYCEPPTLDLKPN